MLAFYAFRIIVALCDEHWFIAACIIQIVVSFFSANRMVTQWFALKYRNDGEGNDIDQKGKKLTSIEELIDEVLFAGTLSSKVLSATEANTAAAGGNGAAASASSDNSSAGNEDFSWRMSTIILSPATNFLVPLLIIAGMVPVTEVYGKYFSYSSLFSVFYGVSVYLFGSTI